MARREDGAGEPGRPGRQVAVGAHEPRRDRPDPGEDLPRALPVEIHRSKDRLTRMRRGTYSIVARDAETGEMGVAVQSHWFGVGALVPWAAPEVGAVATQAIIETAYGPRALELLRGGVDADEALGRLLRADPQAEMRQVAVLDADG